MVLQFQILLAILLFVNIIMLGIISLTVLIIGGRIMNEITQAIASLNAAITALQGRVGNGVIVNRDDLTAAATAINQAANVIGTIGQ